VENRDWVSKSATKILEEILIFLDGKSFEEI